MSLLEAFTFLSFWAFGLGLSKLEQSQISVSTEVKKNVVIYCKVSSANFENDIIHWYRQKPNQALEHLIYVSSTKTPVRSNRGGRNNKLQAEKNSRSLTSMLTINFIEKEDVAIYYCAGWIYGRKLFGDGTKLVITERSLDSSDIAPKPTIFLPSVEEINLHKAGTYLCLLEKFFPDVIKVYWKEKNGNAILASQQGNTVKTKDTYMKFSWLTVTAKSMDKEHKCIVKHENNKRGVDQEILFPPINKGDGTEAVRMQDHQPRNAKNKSLESEKEFAGINSTIDDCLEDKIDFLQLQLTSTSAYYTYLLLILKSLVYFAIISFCLFRRTVVCGRGKSS